MERRSEPRVRVPLAVEVWREGSLLARLRSIDLARGGIGLRGTAGVLPTHGLVDVVVGMCGESHTVRSVLQYVRPDRAGLLFADDADVLWGLLHERLPGLRAA